MLKKKLVKYRNNLISGIFLHPLNGARFSHTNLTCKIISFLINLIKLKIIFNQTFFRETDFNGKKMKLTCKVCNRQSRISFDLR